MSFLDGEAPVILELWGMWSTPSLPLLPDLLRPRVKTPDRALFMGQIELLNIWTMKTNDLGKIELVEVELFDHLIVFKQMTDF